MQAKRRLRDRNRKERKGNGANPVTLSERGLLTPWLRCGTCGGRICVSAGGTPKKPTYLYYCATRQDNREACEGISIRVEKLDALVLGVIEEQVLAPDNVEALIRNSIDQLAAHPIGHAAAERERLDALLTDLDAKIRRTAAQVVNGLIDEDDAKAMNAPLLAQRKQARPQRAALPSAAPPPATDTIDPDAFREAIREAWHDRPLEDRRQALDQLLDEVRLSPGGVHITYSLAGHHGHDPYGPPYGTWGQYRVVVEAAEVRRPRRRGQRVIPATSLDQQPYPRRIFTAAARPAPPIKMAVGSGQHLAAGPFIEVPANQAD